MTVFKNVRDKVSRLLGERGQEETPVLPVYMHPIEYSQVIAVIETLRPAHVLEWGSGGSTRALLEHCPWIESYDSLEHHQLWYERVKELVQDDRLSLHHRGPLVPEPDLPPKTKGKREIINAWMLRCELEPEILQEYIDLPKSFGKTYDFVLVDGRARISCLRVGYELLRPGGILMIHDAQREEYQETMDDLGDFVRLEPWEQGQISFLRKPD